MIEGSGSVERHGSGSAEFIRSSDTALGSSSSSLDELMIAPSSGLMREKGKVEVSGEGTYSVPVTRAAIMML